MNTESLNDRVESIIQAISHQSQRLRLSHLNEDNEAVLNTYIQELTNRFPGRMEVYRQQLSRWAIRTTRYNYVVRISGKVPDIFVLIAHYDTWRGVGADDNTSGEEILKDFIQRDLERSEPPYFSKIYLFAGSEECGLIGLVSQLLASVAFMAASHAILTGSFISAFIALLSLPLLTYRFGVSGSREFVRTLELVTLAQVRAAISVDSVGEGKLYIPAFTMGADFLRAVLPYSGSAELNDLLNEAAHIHRIRYNTVLVGGTTDHLAFLEVNRGLLSQVEEKVRKILCHLQGKPYTSPIRIQASALVAMKPGKASPIVFGGKIHTPRDTPERIEKQPIKETLQILEQVLQTLEQGGSEHCPRKFGEYHYARLFQIKTESSHPSWVLALKDAVEPNQRNINGVYEVEPLSSEDIHQFRVARELGWGVKTHLIDEVRSLFPNQKIHSVETSQIYVTSPEGDILAFARFRPSYLRWIYESLVTLLESLLGRFYFLTIFLFSIILGKFTTDLFIFLVLWNRQVSDIVLRYPLPFLFLIVSGEIVLFVYCIGVKFPTWIDNVYKHENRADNLMSLRRVSPGFIASK